MPIANYTTGVAVEQSMGEIIGALTRRGVRRISSTFDDEGKPAGVAFTMITDFGPQEFELPVRTEGVLNTLKRDKVPPKYQTPEHAAQVAWRIARDWLRAQAALIDAELVTLDEVMLPYMVGNKKGETIYEIVRTNGMKALEAGA